MKVRFAALAALLICCISCVEASNELGGNFIPDNLKYTMVTNQRVLLDVDNRQADSLSGYSNSWAAIGSIRDEDLGLTARSTALYLVPINDSLVFGDNPVIKSFHLSMAIDSVSIADESQRNILQTVNVYGLKEALDPRYHYDTNADLDKLVDWNWNVCKTHPVINGKDSLVIDFTEQYGQQFLSLTKEDFKDIKKYREKVKGFYINTDKPMGNAGRINMYQIQLAYDASSFSIRGNYASMRVSSTIKGVRRDTTYLFYISPSDFYDIDSLLYNTGQGLLPQYALNLTQQDRVKNMTSDQLCVEGGGGLKPHISAKSLKTQVRKLIEDNGDNPDKVKFTKASLTFCYDQPGENYEGLKNFPPMLSPTVRVHGVDTTGGVSVKKVVYQGISDSSSSSENQGDINMSLQQYSPDITYHLQELIATPDSLLDKGDYDIWLLIMSYRTIVSENSASTMDEYYKNLQYQQYYNSMYGYGYGGYGYGYGSYGYGGYGYDPYSNYYSYMMMAQMYSGISSTNTSVSLELDKTKYYKAFLCSKDHPDPDKRPKLVFSYAIPNAF